MKAIRVLHVFHGMDCGGAENMVMNLYRRINRDYVQFDFLVHTEKKCFFDDEINRLGGRIFRAPYFNGLNLKAYKNSLNSFFSSHKEISIVHGHLGSCASIYLDVAKKYGCYTIAHCHSSKPTNVSIKNIAYRLSTYRVRGIADYFIGCSLKAGEYRYGKKITTSNRFSVLNNAIDTDLYVYSAKKRESVRKKLGVSPETVIIGHVGRFTYAKNHEYLLSVFKLLTDKRKNVKLLLIGDGELRAEIENTIRSYAMTDSVILTGVINNVAEYLQAMDVFVFPSRFEGLPVSVIEAQAAGLPCVISDRITKEVSVTELVEYISIDGEVKSWIEAIEKLINNNKRKNRKADIVKAGYDIDATTDWIMKLYINSSKRAGEKEC